jgi:hypothetical protein
VPPQFQGGSYRTVFEQWIFMLEPPDCGSKCGRTARQPWRLIQAPFAGPGALERAHARGRPTRHRPFCTRSTCERLCPSAQGTSDPPHDLRDFTAEAVLEPVSRFCRVSERVSSADGVQAVSLSPGGQSGQPKRPPFESENEALQSPVLTNIDYCLWASSCSDIVEIGRLIPSF